MSQLKAIDEIPAFQKVRGVPIEDVSDVLRDAVKQLHEIHDMEEFVRSILSDRAATAHGPAEIVDILTHRLSETGGLAAFVLKGRSYPTVRPKDVSHQIYRLKKIDALSFAVFGASGVIIDAVKEQFTSTCIELNVDYSIFDADDFARLFWAYGFLCPRDGSRIKGGRCHCGYTPQYAVMNILQEEALKELKVAHDLKQDRGLVVLPPGSGKTRIAAKDAKAYGAKRVLYIAHTHEILDVAKSEFEAVFGVDSVGKMGVSGSAESPILLSTIQYASKIENIQSLEAVDYLIIDEFHHAAAASYRRLIDGVGASFVLGLTATPFRSDRQDIGSLCNNNVICQYELRSGIDFGILTPYHYFGCFDDVDYSDIYNSSGGYSVKDLERKLIIHERHQAVVEKWKERAEGRPTLAFCCSHAHAERVAEEFLKQGVSAATYLSSTAYDERRVAIDDLRLGHLKVICVVDVLNEGADLPFVECLLFLRPTESKRIFVQQLGRGLRRHVGKTHCLVIDFIGNFRNAYRIVEYHGLRPEEHDASPLDQSVLKNTRDVLDLPLGCKVTFEERVIDIFYAQTLDPRNATRENIGRILLHRYIKLSESLGRRATPNDMNRYALLGADFYKRIFGSWAKFQATISDFSPGKEK